MRPDDGRVVSNFIIQTLRGTDLTIYGDGSQTRSFQYIDDLIDGMIAMMNQPNIGPINLCNPIEFTIKELATHVLELIPVTKSKVTYETLPQDDTRQRRPSIALARKQLDWQPQIPLLDGLRHTIAYFESLALDSLPENGPTAQLQTISTNLN